MKIIGISGSLRSGSFNTKLLELVKAAATGHDMTIASISDIPLYNGDVEKAGMPASVTALADQVRAADALYIATPEYNWTIPGVLKNVIDWLSRARPDMPIAGKVTALGGCSGGMLGTATAQEHLRHSLSLLGAEMVNQPQILIAGAHEAMVEPSDMLKDLIAKQIKAIEAKVG